MRKFKEKNKIFAKFLQNCVRNIEKSIIFAHEDKLQTLQMTRISDSDKALFQQFRGKNVAGIHPFEAASKWGGVKAFNYNSVTNLFLVQMSELLSDFSSLTRTPMPNCDILFQLLTKTSCINDVC
ncbi:MAG: hypothetical protein J1E58_07365 [Prevotella sp.]|nr:hypothetical protein [Prevotella sp.]